MDVESNSQRQQRSHIEVEIRGAEALRLLRALVHLVDAQVLRGQTLPRLVADVGKNETRVSKMR